MLINNIFNTVKDSSLYRITTQVRFGNTVTGLTFQASNGSGAGAGTTTTLYSITGPGSSWIGVDFTTTVPKGYRHLKIVIQNNAALGDPVTIHFKNLQAFYLQKAEVQDSDLNWAGRRTSYYEGTKITSTDINVDSPDTIDGGPVITINTVNSDQPTYNPLGVSTIITGTTNNTNQA